MKTLFSLVFILLLTSCQSETDKRLEQTLHLAGENRKEFEKVLIHYKDDTLKLKATRFLIENMRGHTGYDPAMIEILQPVYKKHIAISEKYNWKRPDEWRREIDDFWNEEQNRINLFRYPLLQDINTIKADWLIKEIDLTFTAWKENAYTRDAPFEDFCRYILPYRFNDKFCFENNREVFYNRHHGIFNDRSKDFRVITDSLHLTYSDIMHNVGYAASMPICTISAYEQIKRGICEDQTQFNSHLMSALGMAIATDFVPMWGNRSEGHSWNALIIDGKTYPFEPFWDNERWKYDRAYNNKSIGLKASKFRLPKVYRQTFEYYIDGPIADKEENKENIPGLFKNIWFRDISPEYFQTTDVTIDISETIPANTQYCYLCVYDAPHMKWAPVQWGKINKKKAVFKGMGHDIVYLPAFYQDGTIIPAGPVFILNNEGKCNILKHNKSRKEKIITNTTTPLSTRFTDEISGAYFIGCNDPTNTVQQDTLCTLNDTIDASHNEIRLHSEKQYQHIRLALPKNIIALSEVAFYEQPGDQLKKIANVKVMADVKKDSIKELDKIVDGLSGTGYFGTFNNKNGENRDILFDFGKKAKVHSISFIPQAECQVNNNENFTLYYWDNEWKQEKVIKGDHQFIIFDQVPSDALYLIKRSKAKNVYHAESVYYAERIFTYKNGIIHWY